MKNLKTIGVLGGMGPCASAYFYNLLLNSAQKNLGAIQDDEYPQIIINSLALKGSTEQGMENSALIADQLINGIKVLENAGADFTVIPCNSVHNSIEVLRNKSKKPIISIIEKVSEEVIKNKVNKVLVLSSETTDKYGLYDHLENYGIQIIKPDTNLRKKVTKLILAVMGNKGVEKSKKLIIEKINSLFANKNIDSVILGCTELPLAINQSDTKAKVFNSLDILSAAALRFSAAS